MTQEVQELVNYDSKFGEMNYAKMAAKEPDIEGEGDHLLRSSFLLVPSQAPPGIPFFEILYFIWVSSEILPHLPFPHQPPLSFPASSVSSPSSFHHMGPSQVE